MRQKGTKSDGGSWGIRKYDVRVGCFLSLRQLGLMPKSKISTGKTQQLIELVREHPHLFNPRLPEHRDDQLIHTTWGSIAEVVWKNSVFSALIVRF